MKKLSYFKGIINKALKKSGIYSDALEIQVNNLASALMTLNIANEEIKTLDSVYLINETSQGTTRVLHPAFKVQRDAMEQVTKQMKQLGLTTSEVVGKPDIPDAGDEVIGIVNSIK